MYNYFNTTPFKLRSKQKYILYEKHLLNNLKCIYVCKFYKFLARLETDFVKTSSSNIPPDPIEKESCGSILNMGSDLQVKNYVSINLRG